MYNKDIIDWCRSNISKDVEDLSDANVIITMLPEYVKAHDLKVVTVDYATFKECNKRYYLKNHRFYKGVDFRYMFCTGDYFEMEDSVWRLIPTHENYEAYSEFVKNFLTPDSPVLHSDTFIKVYGMDLYNKITEHYGKDAPLPMGECIQGIYKVIPEVDMVEVNNFDEALLAGIGSHYYKPGIYFKYGNTYKYICHMKYVLESYMEHLLSKGLITNSCNKAWSVDEVIKNNHMFAAVYTPNMIRTLIPYLNHEVVYVNANDLINALQTYVRNSKSSHNIRILFERDIDDIRAAEFASGSIKGITYVEYFSEGVYVEVADYEYRYVPQSYQELTAYHTQLVDAGII